MKKLLYAVSLFALLMPAMALAQSAFNGTWKTDPSSIHDTGKPIVIALKGGMFSCSCSNPAYTVKTDGEDHPVTGHPGFDTVAVKIVDDHTIEQTLKKAGKVVETLTVTAAADGKTATEEMTNDSGNAPVTGKAGLVKVAKAPAGSHLLAGSWKMKNIDNVSDNGLAYTYKVDGSDVSLSTPAGDSYAAKIGGPAVPYQTGMGANDTVSVKKLGPNSLRETYERGGKVLSTSTMTVSADGKSMKTVSHDMHNDITTTSTARKQ
jgi:hypothetical protein